MASLSDMLNIYEQGTQVINALNDLDPVDDWDTYRQRALSFELPHATWGNSYVLVGSIEDAIHAIADVSSPRELLVNTIEINQAYQRLSDYLSESWWQFGGTADKQAQRQQIAQIPTVPELQVNV